jgi:hydrogenase small subunit
MLSQEPNRREFLKLGAALAAAGGLSGNYAALFAQGAERLTQGVPLVLWLQGQTCGGCSVSLLNADSPKIFEAITRHFRLAFHPTLSAAQGRLAFELIEKIGRGTEPFVLVVEGAIPAQVPEACRIGGHVFAEILLPLLRRAQCVVAAGTCASYGGIPSAEGGVTGAKSLAEFMAGAGVPVRGRLVNCPGCPCHSAELLGTLTYLAAKGFPEVRPDVLTPTMFSTICLHYQCPRLPQFNARLFAMSFGDGDGCMYQLGCRGLDVYADCERHRWNGEVNTCLQASAPCIGCNQPSFGKIRDYPFYNKQ